MSKPAIKYSVAAIAGVVTASGLFFALRQPVLVIPAVVAVGVYVAYTAIKKFDSIEAAVKKEVSK